MKLRQRWTDLKHRIRKKKETRFFKKHGVSSWQAYNLKYDKDYNESASSIRHMFHGYPFIAEIADFDNLNKHVSKEYPDGFYYLKNWTEKSCRGKARATIERTFSITCNSPDGGILHRDWVINEFSGQDSVFVGFQDERDYLVFLLKWRAL